MSMSFERFGGAWHPSRHSERSTSQPQLTAEPPNDHNLRGSL